MDDKCFDSLSNPKVYNIYYEVEVSKKILSKLFREDIITYLYPGGYIAESLLDIVSKNYLYARTSEIGINYVNNLRNYPDRYNLKTISFSKYTNFLKIEKYYHQLLKSEDKRELVIIETYHSITDRKNIRYILYIVFYIKTLKDTWDF